MALSDPRFWYRAHPSIGLIRLDENEGPRVSPLIEAELPSTWLRKSDEEQQLEEETFFRQLFELLIAGYGGLRFSAEYLAPSDAHLLLQRDEDLVSGGENVVTGSLKEATVDAVVETNPIVLEIWAGDSLVGTLHDGWTGVALRLGPSQAEALM